MTDRATRIGQFEQDCAAADALIGRLRDDLETIAKLDCPMWDVQRLMGLGNDRAHIALENVAGLASIADEIRSLSRDRQIPESAAPDQDADPSRDQVLTSGVAPGRAHTGAPTSLGDAA